MKPILNFAVIQSGCCVFGAGSTRLAALRVALKHLPPFEDGESRTIAEIAAECAAGRNDGDLMIIERDDDPDEFDSYMRSQGGYIQSVRGNWRNA